MNRRRHHCPPGINPTAVSPHTRLCRSMATPLIIIIITRESAKRIGRLLAREIANVMPVRRRHHHRHRTDPISTERLSWSWSCATASTWASSDRTERRRDSRLRMRHIADREKQKKLGSELVRIISRDTKKYRKRTIQEGDEESQ